MPLDIAIREGVRYRNKSEDLPCDSFFTAFEEKALNLNEPVTGHIILFITVFQRKYVGK